MKLAERLVDRIATGGVSVREISCLEGTEDARRTFRGIGIYFARGPAHLADGSEREFMSAGSGAHVESRVITSVLEVAERIAIFEAGPDLLARFSDFGPGEAVDPRQMVLDLPDDRGDAVRPFDMDAPVDWVRATRRDGNPRYIHRPTRQGRPGFYQVTSSGVAAGAGRDDAIVRGLFELIERDALMLHWYGQLGAPRVPIPSGDGAGALASWLEALDFDLTAYDIGTDLGVPVALVVARQGAPAPVGAPGGVVIGAAAAGLIERAIERAILEIVQAVEGCIASRDSGDPVAATDPLGRFLVSDRGQELAFLEQTGLGPRGGALVEPDRRQRFTKRYGEAPLAALQDSLAGLGIETYWVDRTPPWLLPFSVAIVETFAPGLQPLTLDPSGVGRRIDSPRLREKITAFHGRLIPIRRHPHPLG